MAARNFSNNSPATTLDGALTDVATTVNTANGSDSFPAAPFTLVLDPNGPNEEVIEVTAKGDHNTFTVTRGVDGTTAVAHDSGETVIHGASARDFQDANNHIEATTSVHGITDTSDIVMMDEYGNVPSEYFVIQGSTQYASARFQTTASPANPSFLIVDGNNDGISVSYDSSSSQVGINRWVSNSYNANWVTAGNGWWAFNCTPSWTGTPSGVNDLTNKSYVDGLITTVNANRVRENLEARTGTAYTLVEGDKGKTILLDNASTVTFTMDKDVFAYGDYVTLIQKGAGQVVVAAGDAVLSSLGYATASSGQWGRIHCVWMGYDFHLSGDLTYP